MQTAQKKSLTVLAPAKINLYLHVTGRRDDGLHLLDSLVVFADFGDEIRLKPVREFSFSIEGPYAHFFHVSEREAGVNSGNLVVRAAYSLAAAVGRALDVDIKLIKNLPLAAGIGGGSADAAAAIRALLEYWGLSSGDVPDFDGLLLSLGADVPACMACRPVRVSGIGEVAGKLDDMEELPVVLVNPGVSCATAEIFSLYDGVFSRCAPEMGSDIIAFLKEQNNDLTKAAISLAPSISNILELLESKERCDLARMSGSGSTCFGLFGSELESLDAAGKISRENPDWWVRAGVLNRARC